MGNLGGDGFWLIVPPEGRPMAVTQRRGEIAGHPGSLRRAGANSAPRAQAALTVAGTVSGWDEALKISQTLTGKAAAAGCWMRFAMPLTARR